MARDIFSLAALTHAAHRPFFLNDAALPDPLADTLLTAPVAWRTLAVPPPLPPAVHPAAGHQALAGAATALFVLGGALPAALANLSISGTHPRTTDNVDLAIRGDEARGAYGVTGAGIRIGILSDSFNALGGMAADIANGDLPAGVRILDEGPAGSHDEGRAMADIVHSIAPGAQILFATATDGEASFAANIAALQAAGCNVIVDDVAYLDEPFFQDGGAVSTAVQNAVAAGVSYFTAASNEGQDFVQQTFTGMRVALPGLPGGATVQNFGTRTAPQPWVNIVLPTGGMLELDMQWNQPFASIGGGAGSADSMGLALYTTAGRLVASATANETGGNPDQVLQFTNTTGATAFRLVVYANGGAAPPGMFKIINYGNGNISGGNVGQGSGTVIGHEMVMGDNTVGAMAWSSSPAFDGGNMVEPFSSVGAGGFLLDANGNPLVAPQSSNKVNFLAPDGNVTSVFAPFYGTSAAAPAAAAVAALMLQANPHLTPAQVTALLEQSAEPANGPALATGAGLIEADRAVGLALGLAHH